MDNEGWLHTGDVGFIDRDGFLTVTSRKKDLFKDSSGRYIAPSKVENRLRQAPEIQYAVVFGDERPFPVALIFTDRQFAPGDANTVCEPDHTDRGSNQSTLIEALNAFGSSLSLTHG